MILWKAVKPRSDRGSAVLNKKYDEVISSYVDTGTRERRDASAENILADAIVNGMLKQNLYRSFYDRAAIGPGTSLEPTIESAARAAFCLLQIIERETFVVLPEPNLQRSSTSRMEIIDAVPQGQ